MSEELGEFLEILPPQKRVSEHWYQAVRPTRPTRTCTRSCANLIALSVDHVYKMDYAHMLRFHQDRKVAVTLAAIEVPRTEGLRFGIVAIDEQKRVPGSPERPAEPIPTPWSPDLALASMGAYIFDIDVLVRVLEADAAEPTTHDAATSFWHSSTWRRSMAYRFYDENEKASQYWRDIGILDAYFETNMDLCQVNPELNLYDPEWPPRACQPQALPEKFVFAEMGQRCGQALDSLISPGCIVSGSGIYGSVLCPNVRVHSFCHIERCVLMPGVCVGRHARIRRAIIDRDALIPRGALIGYDSAEDRRRHTVTDSGVVVVTTNDEPLVSPVSEESLRHEAKADRRGGR